MEAGEAWALVDFDEVRHYVRIVCSKRERWSELESVAAEAAFYAAMTYDESHGASLLTWQRIKMRYAILDVLRGGRHGGPTHTELVSDPGTLDPEPAIGLEAAMTAAKAYCRDALDDHILDALAGKRASPRAKDYDRTDGAVSHRRARLRHIISELAIDPYHPPRRPPYRSSELTPRSIEILQRVADGASLSQARAAMGITQNTSKRYLNAAYRRLGLTGQRNLVAGILEATRRGYIKVDGLTATHPAKLRSGHGSPSRSSLGSSP